MTQVSHTPTGRSAPRSVPVVRVLMLDFTPAQIAELWHSAASVLPAIEVRMYCRTCLDLDRTSTLADKYDIVLVDASEQAGWFPRLEKVPLKSLLETTVVIAGIEPLGSVQAALLRAGYADVISVQDSHARTIVNTTIKAFLRQLRTQQIELPPAVATPIQRALI